MDQTGVSLIEESWGQLSLREKQVLLDVFLMDGHHHKALLGAICQGIFSNGPKFQSGAANLEKIGMLGLFGPALVQITVILDISIMIIMHILPGFAG